MIGFASMERPNSGEIKNVPFCISINLPKIEESLPKINSSSKEEKVQSSETSGIAPGALLSHPRPLENKIRT